MSSDGYFEDDIDPAVFEQLDAIEAAHYLPEGQPNMTRSVPRSLAKDDSFCDMTFDIDETEMQRIDNFIEDTYEKRAIPVVPPGGPAPKSTRGAVQTTLFGDVLQQNSPTSSRPKSKARTSIQRTKSTPRNPFGQHAPKTKQWDRTAFAKSGIKKPKLKAKGKAKENDSEAEEEGEEFEFDQFPAPFMSGKNFLLLFNCCLIFST